MGCGRSSLLALASVPVVAIVVLLTRPGRGALRAVIWLVVASGVLDMAANLFYLEASHRGLLSIVAVISAMYPVSTVCLAFGLDHERVSASHRPPAWRARPLRSRSCR